METSQGYIKIIFSGESGKSNGRVTFDVIQECPPENLAIGAAALMRIAGQYSTEGFERTIETITKRVMATKAHKET